MSRWRRRLAVRRRGRARPEPVTLQEIVRETGMPAGEAAAAVESLIEKGLLTPAQGELRGRPLRAPGRNENYVISDEVARIVAGGE